MENPFKDKQFEILEKHHELYEAVSYSNKIKGSFIKPFDLFSAETNKICISTMLVSKVPPIIKEILQMNKHIRIISKSKKSHHVVNQLITSILNFTNFKVVVLSYHNDFKYEKLKAFHMKMLKVKNAISEDMFNERVILSSSLNDLNDIISFISEMNKVASFINEKVYIIITDSYYLLDEEMIDLSVINPNVITVIYLSKLDNEPDSSTVSYGDELLKLIVNEEEEEEVNYITLLDKDREISFSLFHC